MRDTLSAIIAALQKYSYAIGDEKSFQSGIETVLKFAGVDHRREVKAGASDRFDFLCEGGVVIEAKVKGSFATAIRQASRYLEHADVTAVILVATKLWAQSPEARDVQHQSNGKSVHIVHVRGQSF